MTILFTYQHTSLNWKRQNTILKKLLFSSYLDNHEVCYLNFNFIGSIASQWTNYWYSCKTRWVGKLIMKCNHLLIDFYFISFTACPVNQVYRCGFPKTLGFTCEPTCLPVNPKCFVIRVACTDGCYCKDGYKLSGNKCVLTCPKVIVEPVATNVLL